MWWAAAHVRGTLETDLNAKPRTDHEISLDLLHRRGVGDVHLLMLTFRLSINNVYTVRTPKTTIPTHFGRGVISVLIITFLKKFLSSCRFHQ